MNQSGHRPDHTAERVALWRALHLEVDSAPPVFDDEFALKLLSPDPSWRARPDMDPSWTRAYRASIVGRARWIEDVLEEKIRQGVEQIVILGSGLDTISQRKKHLQEKLHLFEVDQKETIEWKIERFNDLKWGVGRNHHWVSLDLVRDENAWGQLLKSGFNVSKPTFVMSVGLSMYLTPESNSQTLLKMGGLPRGSTFVMTYMLPLDLLDPDERPKHQAIYQRAKEAGTPFLSFYSSNAISQLARESGFGTVEIVTNEKMIERYFMHRGDGLKPSRGEEILIAAN